MVKTIVIIISVILLSFFTFSSIPIYLNPSGTGCLTMARPYDNTEVKFLGLPWKSERTWLCGYKGWVWGPSLVEYAISFKHSIDANGFYFL